MDLFRSHFDLFNQSLSQAEIDFNEVIARNPYALGTYLLLGETKSLQGNWLEARQYYEKAMNDSRFKKKALAGLKHLKINQQNVSP